VQPAKRAATDKARENPGNRAKLLRKHSSKPAAKMRGIAAAATQSSAEKKGPQKK
jgi:hypothetical protein